MHRLIYMLAIMTMFAAGAANGSHPAQRTLWRAHLSKAKGFFSGDKGMPASLQKALLGITAAGDDWVAGTLACLRGLLPASAYYPSTGQ